MAGGALSVRRNGGGVCALAVNMIGAEDLLLMLMISVTGVDLRAQLLLTNSGKTHTHTS